MHVSGLVSTLVVVRLACRWPALLRTTRKMEDDLPMFRSRNMASACNTITALVFLCELYTISFVLHTRISADCYDTESAVEAYFKYTGAWIFKTSEFSSWKAILFQHPGTWAAFRRRYTRLAALVRAADTEVGPLVLISFTSNLVYVCVQIFKVIRTLESIERVLYFGFSSVFITARALLVGLLASRLHSAALAPSSALCEAPADSYTAEARILVFLEFHLEKEKVGQAQRFLDQIRMSKITLTGLGFFHITRRTVLSMLASIVTYELMLLQFTGK
ncbi:Gustatory receptor for sugar taste 64f [Eumeta japonica]|uniref:Gustatory receptor for sugar taste 64f n=1 Tax=Eumeta variegata TaxID=151549 RepID=A0A4C1UJ15_EUMVA|nr:Gustatory receptor for sugar taste 64f [Eumeta japonica]